jgi:hypothetical protein
MTSMVSWLSKLAIGKIGRGPGSAIGSRNAAGPHPDNAGRVPGRYAGRMEQRSPTQRTVLGAKFNERIASIIDFFLSYERGINKNDHWFSVEEVADALNLRELPIAYIIALQMLVRRGTIEGRDGCMRHV